MGIDKKQTDEAIRILKQMLAYLGLGVEATAIEEKDGLVLKISCEDAGRLIGRKGRTMENLQYLFNRILAYKDATFPEVTLDIDGYQKRGRERGESRRGDDDRPARGGDERPARGGDERSARGGDERSARGGDERSARNDDERPARGGDERPARGRDERPARPRETRPSRRGDDRPRSTAVALETVKEVKRWGESRTIGPFNPEECEAIRSLLAGEAGIQVTDAESAGRLVVSCAEAQG